jgi:uncharacterized protein with NRDE domain
VCTLTLAWQVFPDVPVVVAANRDERFDRPAEPPARLETDPVVVAPRDAEAGGTWLGHNEHGLFVGVTNRWANPDLAGERSRGLLVRDALREPSAEAAVRLVEDAVEADEYSGFNLVLADAAAAFLLEWDGRLRVRRFDPGVHVVVNVGASDAPFVPEQRPEVGERQAENAAAVRAALAPDPGEGADSWLSRAKATLADHDYGVCIHPDPDAGDSDGPSDEDDSGFGTVSASAVRIDADGDARFEYADGPPCETAFEPVAAVDASE